MRHTGRVISLGALAVLLLSLPAISFAADPKDPMREPGSAPAAMVPAALTLVPGATVGTVGISDAVVYADTAGGTIVVFNPVSASFVYNSWTGYPVLASLGLPAGATLWQVDVYGYATGATFQSWNLADENIANGGYHDVAGSAPTSSGPGIVTAKMSFPSGLTLAPGHSWYVVLASTSATSGFSGAIFQYTLPTLSLVPMTPVRVFDSRFSSRVVQGAPRTINVKDAINVSTGAVTTPNAIPQGAKAVSYTVTATNTGIAGFVSVLPGTSTTVTASTVNWTGSGATIAAGGIVSLGTGTAERQVTLVVGGGGSSSTDVIVDITGYFR
ncbi:MAG: hypothetical protein ABSE70_03035 [Candidatus Limnocylindrales bacterium]